MKVLITLVVTLVGLYVLFWHIPAYGIHWNTSNGEHTGYVTAVEENGLIFKTPSVYIKTKLDSSQEDRYCIIKDSALIEELRTAAIEEKRITIEFEDWFIRGFTNCSTHDIAVVNNIK